jgi:hypothetical protein
MAIQIGGYSLNGFFVIISSGKLQQLSCFVERISEAAQCADDSFQLGTLAAELLCALGIVPNVRDFQFPANLGQAFASGIKVKDTPSRPLIGLACL